MPSKSNRGQAVLQVGFSQEALGRRALQQHVVVGIVLVEVAVPAVDLVGACVPDQPFVVCRGCQPRNSALHQRAATLPDRLP